MNRCLILIHVAAQLGIALGMPTDVYEPPAVDARLRIMEIGYCFSKTNRPGNYRISGSVPKEESAEICMVKIEAPDAYRVEIVVDRTVHQICQTPNVKLLFEEKANAAAHERYSICSIGSNQSSADEFVNIKSVSSSALIIYRMTADQELLFSVRFTKRQLSCGDHATADRVGEPIVLTNQHESGPCRVFLPGGIRIHVDRLEFGRGQRKQCRNGNYLRVRTGNGYHSMSFTSNFCQKSNETDSIAALCRATVVELHSNSPKLATAILRFSFAPHDQTALAVC